MLQRKCPSQWIHAGYRIAVYTEKYGSAKTQKIFIGEEITYQLKGEEEWRTAYIEDLLVEQNIILLGPRYITLDSIAALRYHRAWTKPRSHRRL